jgi:glycosyltransferase involved in cell wall biosynthesis
VVTTPEDGPQEAVTEGRTGFVAPLDEPARWESAFRRIATDDGLAEAVRREARRWTEENYDARRNAAVLAAAFRSGGRQEP